MKNLLILILIMTAALYSCNKDNSLDNNKVSAITFRLTDAPGDYDKVNVDIVGVEVIVNDSTINLDVNSGIYNLLDFVNGKDTVLVDQQIPSGNLSQIRLILGDNNSVIIGPDSFGLETPSAQQSGLKLNVHASFLPGVAYEYTIDFDAARSIVNTGNGKYILKPVIKVFTSAVSGAIEGVISPVDARPVIYAISTQLDTVSTFPDTISGNFMFRGVTAGIYQLKFLPLSPFTEKTLPNIEVKTGLVTKLDTLKFQ